MEENSSEKPKRDLEKGLGGQSKSFGEDEMASEASGEVKSTKEESMKIPEVPSAEEPEIEKELESTENATIYETTAGDQLYYRINLPELSDMERRIVNKVRERAIEQIDVDPRNIADVRKREELFLREVKEMFRDGGFSENISSSKIEQMAEMVVRDMIGFGLLDILLEDDSLEDILITATDDPVYVYHREYGMCVTNLRFHGEEDLLHQIEKMARHVGRRIDQQNPLLDATLPDGSRVNATIPPVSLDGPTLSIRKFRKDPLTLIDLIDYGTLTPDVAAFLWLAVEGYGVKPSNVIFAGGTACGKSTTMNAVSAVVPPRERIISIEDTAELNLPHKHWIRLETRLPNVEGRGEITMDDLVKNALRMRPDRIVVGEVRGPEARTMFTGMNTGHDGCMGTIHSNSAMETVTRLTQDPMNVPELMISALDAIVMQHRIHRRGSGSDRRITEIAEVSGFEEGKPQLSRIYKWDAKEDTIKPTGVPSSIKQTVAEFAGVSGKEVEREIKRRAAVLEWMRQNGIRDIEGVGDAFRKYYRDSEALLDKIESEYQEDE